MERHMIAIRNVKSKILKEVSKVGNHTLLMYKYLSDHPKDEHLFLVLARDRTSGTYTTWIFNDSSGGLAEGHYCLGSIADAVSDIGKREYVTNGPDANPTFPIQFWDEFESVCLE